MTKQELLESIITDLGANFRSGDNMVLEALLDETIGDALRVSNRRFKVSFDEETGEYGEGLSKQLTVLSGNIRRCVKSLYLQRGAEDTASQSQSGLSSTYDDAVQRMRDDIIKSGKRIMV